MPATQQQEIFDTKESQRFAVLMAGFDLGNENEAEAMGKGRALRRMVAGKKFEDGKSVRLVDALELPEIRAALDDQMQPARQPLPDVMVLEAENEELRRIVVELRDMQAKDMGHVKWLVGVTRLCAGVVLGVGGFVLAMASVAGVFHALHHNSEPAQAVAYSAETLAYIRAAGQTDTREMRSIPASLHPPGTLGLLKCPEGVKGSACDAFVAKWIASGLASQASAKKTRRRKPRLVPSDEELLEQIKPPDESTQADSAAPPGDAPAVSVPKTETLGWSHLLGPGYKGGPVERGAAGHEKQMP